MSMLILAAVTDLGQTALTKKDVCPADRALQVSASAANPGPRRLSELPEGRLMRAVIRSVGPCAVVEVKSKSGWVLQGAGRESTGVKGVR